MCASVNKLPTSPSPTTIERKLQSMGTFFENCRKIHNELIIQTDDEVTHYIIADEFGNVESRYLEVIDFLTSLQDKLAAIPSTSFSNTTSAFQPTPRCNLEKIALPMFDGDYKDWTQFKDLFEALVLREITLTDVQKLYYLKTSLSGSALALIKNIAVTDANFTTAWKIISDHYQDIQIMTFSLIFRMLK
ncbi:hypothetical protein ALC56_06922 [Trachymyrmex septentrionalis]|uniref:Uncharacterized protein n=1 Tax=Trachymyrmex septentrionalis TaxID=34720 RepID=A0A151JWJ8_9HYME|nr:hypothetical protein ALC56_06922 [Trachymyrmex septentrionalis]